MLHRQREWKEVYTGEEMSVTREWKKRAKTTRWLLRRKGCGTGKNIIFFYPPPHFLLPPPPQAPPGEVCLYVCMYVCLYVCMYVSFSFFAIYSKNLQATHTSKFVIICNIFLRMPLRKKKFQKFCVRGCTALFGHQVQNNFFALIKKYFYKP